MMKWRRRPWFRRAARMPGAHMVRDYERPADDAHPLGRDDLNCWGTRQVQRHQLQYKPQPQALDG